MPKFWEKHFLGYELLVSLLAAGAFGAWLYAGSGEAAITTALTNNRGAVYGALTSVFASLLGFAIAAVAIVLGYAESAKFGVLRSSSYYRTLWDVFTSAIRAFALATVISLTALILDRAGALNTPVTLLLFFSIVLAALRTMRVVWVLENVIQLLTR